MPVRFRLPPPSRKCHGRAPWEKAVPLSGVHALTVALPRHVFPAFPGLVWGHAFDAEGNARPVDEQAAAAMKLPEEGFLWLHIDLVDVRARQWLAGLSVVPEPLRRLMLDAEDHQRVLAVGAFVGIVLTDNILEFDHRSDDLGQLRCIVGERLLISGRRNKLCAVAEAHEHVSHGHVCPAVGDLLATIVGRVLGHLEDAGDRLADAVDRVEDRVLADHLNEEMRALGPLRRELSACHRRLTGLRALFQRLSHEGGRGLPLALAALCGPLIERIDAAVHDVAAAQERARLLQDEISARLAVAANRNLYVLSLITTFFLPPAFVAGIFGMNTADLPFLETPGGTWWALALCVAATAATLMGFRWLSRRG